MTQETEKVSQPIDKEIENNFAVVPRMWQEAAINGTIQNLASLMDATPKGLLGVSVYIIVHMKQLCKSGFYVL